MKLFCNHIWVVLKETVTESKLEHSLKILKEITKNANIPGHMMDAERKHITIMACSLCGKLKRYIEII